MSKNKNKRDCDRYLRVFMGPIEIKIKTNSLVPEKRKKYIYLGTMAITILSSTLSSLVPVVPLFLVWD
jgi:hypothetical protein